MRVVKWLLVILLLVALSLALVGLWYAAEQPTGTARSAQVITVGASRPVY